jgi:hypothetical protein
VSLPALFFKSTDVFMRKKMDFSRVLQFFYVFCDRFINGRGVPFWTSRGHNYARKKQNSSRNKVHTGSLF